MLRLATMSEEKHNSEVIAINNETVWVIRAKEVREEKIAPFAEVKDTVRAAYLRSEAAKLAEESPRNFGCVESR